MLQRIAPYYTVLLQYCSSTAPVVLCTTKCYSVLQSATAVLQNTIPTQYYKSITPYYKVVLQYYKVLLRTDKSYMKCHWHWEEQCRRRCPTSPNTVPATKNHSHDESSSHMQRHLHCVEQEISSTNVTQYCACHENWVSRLIIVTCEPFLHCAQQQMSFSNLTKYYACQQNCLTCCILVTPETFFTMRGATSVTLQPHQILRLPRNKIHHCSPSHMKRHLQCAEQQVSPYPINQLRQFPVF